MWTNEDTASCVTKPRYNNVGIWDLQKANAHVNVYIPCIEWDIYGAKTELLIYALFKSCSVRFVLNIDSSCFEENVKKSKKKYIL